MSDLEFGITLTIVGMGGTLLTLWLLSVATVLLKKIFPVASRLREKEEHIRAKKELVHGGG